MTDGNTDQDSVQCTRFAASLYMSKCGDSRVETQTIGQDVFDMFGTNWIQMAVMRALRYDNNGLSLPDLAVLCIRLPSGLVVEV